MAGAPRGPRQGRPSYPAPDMKSAKNMLGNLQTLSPAAVRGCEATHLPVPPTWQRLTLILSPSWGEGGGLAWARRRFALPVIAEEPTWLIFALHAAWCT